MSTPIHIDPNLVERRIMELARIGACEETGVCRAVYTPERVAAQDVVARWFAEAGLATRRDAVGTVWGRVEGSHGGLAIVSGSHIDTQLPGGRYDGALGVIAALTAIEALQRQFGPPRRPLEALSFCEEEGSRFPGASFWGSRAVCGHIDAGVTEQVRDREGVTIGAAMRAVGLDPARIGEAVRNDVDVFIELHIEQGPILEQAGVPAGVVNVINGARSYQAEVTGVSNHAGAMPMDLRRDPLVGASEMFIAIAENALRMGRPAVSTVGYVNVQPGWPAIIPEKVTFSINARHNDRAQLEVLAAQHEQALTTIAARRNLHVRLEARGGLDPVPCDAEIVGLLELAAHEQGIPFQTMPSGALHDTQRMAAVARVAMVFVQSKDGRSHTPVEFTATEHAVAGIQVLAAALHKLAYADAGATQQRPTASS